MSANKSSSEFSLNYAMTRFKANISEFTVNYTMTSFKANTSKFATL